MVPTKNLACELFWNALQRLRQVLQELFIAIWLTTNDLVQCSGLFKVFICNSCGECRYMACVQLMGRHLHPFALGHRAELRENIVRVTTIVSVHSTRTIAYVRSVDGVFGLVWRELEIVGTNAVAVRIRVTKHSRLQHWVCRWADTGNHVGRGKTSLLNVLEIVVRL